MDDMTTITSATIARGYSGYDHLLDDRPLASIVGMRYSMRRVARALSSALDGTQDRRCGLCPVHVETSDGHSRLVWPA